MRTKVKYSERNDNLFENSVENCKATELSKISSKFSTFESTTNTESNKWLSKYENNIRTETQKTVLYEGTTYERTVTNYTYYASNVPGYYPGSGSSDRSQIVRNIRSYIASEIEKYKGYRNTVSLKLDDLIEHANLKIDKLLTLLNSISEAVRVFEETGVSLKDSLERLANESNLSLDGLSFNNVTLEDGSVVEQVMFTYTDENGNEVTISIAEAVNAFYTYYGTATDSLISYELLYDEMGLSEADRDKHRTLALLDTAGFVDTYSQQGAYKLATEDSIHNVYAATVGDNADLTGDIEKDYESVLLNLSDKMKDNQYADTLGEILGGGTNAALALGMTMASGVVDNENFPLTRELSKEDEDRIKKQEEKNEIVNQQINEENKEEDTPVKPASISVDENPEVVEGGGDGEPEEVLPEGTEEETVPEEVVPEDTVPEPEDGTETEGGEGDEDGEGGEGDGETPPTGDEEAVTPPTIEEPTTEEPPSAIDDTLTNEDIDRMAEEEFYNQFDDEGLAEYRQNHIEEFDNLYENDREGLVEYLEESGYSPSEASSIADDKALGMVAFLAAKQTSDMAGISNGIAQSHNVDMSTFDTSYDNGASYQDLMDGNANAFISNPNESPKVNDAKVSMNEAKSNYNSAVNEANSSVDKANEDKEKLNNVKKEIVSKSGEDTDDWSEEDIEKYNDAVKDYNESVQKANENVNKAQEAKNAYEDSKKAYDDAKEEYYNEIKQEVQAGREDEYYNPTPEPEQPDTTPSKPQTPPDSGGVVQDDDSLGIGSETGQGDQGGNTGNVTQDDDSLGIGGAGSSVEPEPDATTQPVKPQEETQDSGGVVTNPDSLGF